MKFLIQLDLPFVSSSFHCHHYTCLGILGTLLWLSSARKSCRIAKIVQKHFWSCMKLIYFNKYVKENGSQNTKTGYKKDQLFERCLCWKEKFSVWPETWTLKFEITWLANFPRIILAVSSSKFNKCQYIAYN